MKVTRHCDVVSDKHLAHRRAPEAKLAGATLKAVASKAMSDQTLQKITCQGFAYAPGQEEEEEEPGQEQEQEQKQEELAPTTSEGDIHTDSNSSNSRRRTQQSPEGPRGASKRVKTTKE
ncbi:unnamed protein product [Phytophthora lilii]|uniref:Unnamed protein product n=1 Tax=Phytophthora lilii TaxID=2077276 RepID=A0A9W6TXI0_9STRA|nr:unnamed protein product [Phytophthora lilii]